MASPIGLSHLFNYQEAQLLCAGATPTTKGSLVRPVQVQSYRRTSPELKETDTVCRPVDTKELPLL